MRVLPAPSTNSDAGGAEVSEFTAPDALSQDERAVWLALAPHALQRQTLTRATAFAFELLCRNVVLERAMSADPETRGDASHRGIIQRIDAELAAFDLRPNGKPHAAPAKPADKPQSPLERLRAGLSAVKGGRT